MCGIGVVLQHLLETSKSEALSLLLSILSTYISSRGPDSFSNKEVNDLIFLASVLHIQGGIVGEQPFVDASGNYLVWNGEVFGGKAIKNLGIRSDTSLISQTFSEIFASDQTNANDVNSAMGDIVSFLTDVEGPFAFIYYLISSRILIFGRDPLGRRSLIKLIDGTNGNLVGLCSVAPTESILLNSKLYWEEVDIHGLCYIQLGDIYHNAQQIHCIPWPYKGPRLGPTSLLESERNEDTFLQPTSILESARRLLHILQDAIQRRVDRLSPKHLNSSSPHAAYPVGALFSGGLDSVVLAALLHLCTPEPYSIDLFNVTFSSEKEPSSNINSSEEQKASSSVKGGSAPRPDDSSPDRVAAIASLVELQELYPTRHWRLVHIDVSAEERMESKQRIQSLIHVIDRFYSLFHNQTIPPYYTITASFSAHSILLSSRPFILSKQFCISWC